MERYVYYTGPECVCCAGIRKQAAEAKLSEIKSDIRLNILTWGLGTQAEKVLRDLLKTLESKG
jgi:hypothetical protein